MFAKPTYIKGKYVTQCWINADVPTGMLCPHAFNSHDSSQAEELYQYITSEPCGLLAGLLFNQHDKRSFDF